MKSLILTMTVVLGMLYVPAIEMKRIRCHKRLTVVECPNPLPRTCATSWNMIVTTDGKVTGSIGKVTCSAGHSLHGNDSITCLDSGVWSPINAICVPNDISTSDVRSFSGSAYTFVRTTKTYQQAKASCSSMCGTLIEINNEEENNFIISVMDKIPKPEDFFQVYIGLESMDGITYTWQSGNTTKTNKFEYWERRLNEPNSITIGSCAYSNFYENGNWIDDTKNGCIKPFSSICEFRFD